jgi:curved DNA-binding protein
MEYKDYYKILGVPKNATEKDIKAAYRRLARKHHPDVNRNDPKSEARFKEINEANEVLSDPAKRRRYDSLGPDWERYARAGRPGPQPGGGQGRVRVDFGGFGEEDVGGFSDFFRTIFGGGFGGAAGGAGPGGATGDLDEEAFRDIFTAQQGRARGHDLETTVDLTLDEVLRGTTRTVQLGEGPQIRKVEVKVPAGVRDGSRVRVAGEGGAGRGGARGDLYLRVRVVPHPQFERHGNDLHTTVRVPLTTAVLGGEVSVPTLEGAVGIKVPAGSQPGRKFRLRGHGLPNLEARGTRGDLIATLGVDLPRDLTPREREIFEELRRLER